MAPSSIFLNTEADEILLPTNTGQMGVLPNHADLITGLDIGVIFLRAEGKWNSFALMGGFAFIKQNKITILVNDAESAKNIDFAEAENSFNSAKVRLAESKNQKQKIEASVALKRAKARYLIVKQNNK